MRVFLYILRSEKDKGFYIGISEDPEKRLEQHNSGIGESTKSRAPFKLLAAKEFNDYKEARRVEKILKKYTRIKIMKFVEKVRACPN